MPSFIYAEHLINIHTLSIQVSLPSKHNSKTKVSISADGSVLLLDHDGEHASITLPVALTDRDLAAFQLPSQPSRLLSFRVNLKKASNVESDLAKTLQIADNVVPWTSSDLTSSTTISCSTCSTALLPSGLISAWKDLPTEGWAEMMEFWHCHKPDEPHSGEQVSNKGYAAMSKLSIHPGIGLVGPTSILLDPADLHNAETCETKGNGLLCKQCSTILGREDVQNASCHVNKHALSVSLQKGFAFKSYDHCKWAACSLLTAMDSQGARKFTVTTSPIVTEAILLWIFAPDICVASTNALNAEPTRYMKVMWKGIAAEVAVSNGDKLSANAAATGAIELSQNEYSLLLICLKESAGLLPETMQHFQDWNVTILQRFTINDLQT